MLTSHSGGTLSPSFLPRFSGDHGSIPKFYIGPSIPSVIPTIPPLGIVLPTQKKEENTSTIPSEIKSPGTTVRVPVDTAPEQDPSLRRQKLGFRPYRILVILWFYFYVHTTPVRTFVYLTLRRLQ